MEISKIYIYGKYIRLNFYRTSLEFLNDTKKNPSEINRMYDKWFATDVKSVKRYNELSEYYSEFIGITDPTRIEIFDNSNNSILTKDINNINELLDYTKQNLYPILGEKEITVNKDVFRLNIKKEHFLWKDDSVGLLFGGFQGEGVIKFDLIKHVRNSPGIETTHNILNQDNVKIFFDVTTFWDSNICKPFIDNLYINYELFYLLRDDHTKESFEPFTTEIIPTRLGKLSKHRKLIINPRVGLNS